MCDFIKPKEISSIMGVTILTVYKWLKEGIIPSIRPKRQIYVRRDDFDKFLAGLNI